MSDYSNKDLSKINNGLNIPTDRSNVQINGQNIPGINLPEGFFANMYMSPNWSGLKYKQPLFGPYLFSGSNIGYRFGDNEIFAWYNGPGPKIVNYQIPQPLFKSSQIIDRFNSATAGITLKHYFKL